MDDLELIRIEVVQTVQVHGNEVAPEVGEVTRAVAVDAAVLAEVPRRDVSSPLVVATIGFTREESEGGGFTITPV